MSPQDSVERVLKEIHIAFSQSETYNGEPNKMIVDRKQFLELLDKLNHSIFDMLEQYEQTRQSRDNAERAFNRKADEILEDANRNAEQIYAAAMLYTEDAIDRVSRIMNDTAESMNDLFRGFRREMRDQKDTLKEHEVEIHSQLVEMADSQKYLTILQQMNDEKNRRERDLAAERLAGERYRTSMINPAEHRPHNPNIEVKVNTNSPYFKMNGGGQTEDEEQDQVVVKVADQNSGEEVKKAESKRLRRRKKQPEPDNLDLELEKEESEDMDALSNAIAAMVASDPDEYLEGGSNPVPELTEEEEAQLTKEMQEAYAREKKEHLAEMQSELDDLEFREITSFEEQQAKEKQGNPAGRLLKNLVFGKDEV